MNQFPMKNFCSTDQDEYNFLTCSRYIVSFIASAIITIISIIFCFRTFKNNENFVCELIPMLLCVVQGAIHTFQFSILNENHLTLLANLTQIVIFSLVGFTFSQAYKRLQSNEILFNFRKRSKFAMILAVYFILFLIQLLCICLTQAYHCNPFFYVALIITIIDILTTSIVIFYYGNKLKKILTLVNQRFSYNRRNSNSSNVLQLLESDLPKEKLIQIKVVVFSLTFNTILYLAIIILLFFVDKDILCNFKEDYELNLTKNIVLFIFIITQLFPCFIVPYAFSFRLKKNVDTQIKNLISVNGYDLFKDRNLSITIGADEGNDQFVQRLTRGKANQE